MQKKKRVSLSNLFYHGRIFFSMYGGGYSIMENLVKFENKDFGEIRSLTINNAPWFVGKDVASALGYTDVAHAVLDHVDEDDRINSKTHGQNVPEFGQRGTWLT